MSEPSYTADPDYRTLVAAVHADRSDRTARLVLADWVQDHGDDAEAAAIRAGRSGPVDVAPALASLGTAARTMGEGLARALAPMAAALQTMAETLAAAMLPRRPAG